MKKQFFERFEKTIKGGIYVVLAIAVFAVFCGRMFLMKNAVIIECSSADESGGHLSSSVGTEKSGAASDVPVSETHVESSRTEYAPSEYSDFDRSAASDFSNVGVSEEPSEASVSEQFPQTVVPEETENSVTSAPEETESSAPSAPEETENSASSIPEETENSAPSVPKETENSVTSIPEEFPVTVSIEEPSSANSSDKSVPSFPININTASAEELQSLTGIGEVKAKAIVEYREQHGSFTDITQIMNVKGIGKKTFLVIKESITVGSDTPAATDISESTPAADDLININTATAEELQTLYGIGEAKAAAIIAYREQNGAFTDISQIMNVKGIGEKIFAAIRDKITV